MEGRIYTAVEAALKALGIEGVPFVVERPNALIHGDYTTNAALVAAKQVGKNPRELADELAEKVRTLGVLTLGSVEVAGPGFLNFTLTREAVHESLIAAVARGEEWGRGKERGGKRVMVEYTDPNPFKEMHIGHLMSNVIGEAISRLIQNEGAEVVRACYQGDVGPHVAKAIWGLRKLGVNEPTTAAELGEAYATGSRAYEDSPETKTEIDALNQAIYAGEDHHLMELWRRGRDVSLQAFAEMYRRLETHFDFYFFESETSEPGMRMVKDGVAKGIFKESEGALIYEGEKKGLHTLVFVTSRGTPTYEAKDVGLAFLKEERASCDQSIIVTAAEQIGHFKVFLAALEEIAPIIAAKTMHVPHGFLRLTSGKMSSREGNVITAEGLLKEVSAKASEKSEDPLIAEQVAIGAVKFMILRQSPGQDIIFDPEKSLSLEGDSGPYLQYALVRANSILQKVEETKGGGGTIVNELSRLIGHYPNVAARAARELAPNLLVNYLLELAGEWNSFYARERILGEADEAAKLELVRAFAQTMTNGLIVLGIPTPTKM